MSDRPDQLRAAFEAMDLDGSGTLSLDEIRIAYRRHMGGYATRDDAAAYLARCDLNDDGEVSWEEFLSYATATEQSAPPPPPSSDAPSPGELVERTMASDPELAANLLRRFQALDTDRSGRLTFDEVLTGLRAEGVEDDWAVLRREMDRLDHSGDGKVSYAEFLAAHVGHPATSAATGDARSRPGQLDVKG